MDAILADRTLLEDALLNTENEDLQIVIYRKLQENAEMIRTFDAKPKRRMFSR